MRFNSVFSWFFTAAVFCSTAGADSVELSQIRNVGRLLVFSSKAAGGTRSWVLPTAFQTSLECSPQAGADPRLCMLRIFNFASSVEAAGIAAAFPISELPGSPLLKVESSLDSPLALAGAGNPILLDPLQFRSEKSALVSVGYRYRPGIDAEIPALYEGVGLGKLAVTARLRARRTHEVMALKEVRALDELRKSIGPDGLAPRELRAKLDGWAAAQSWLLSDVEPTEARVLAPRLVQWRFFGLSSNGRYFWKEGVEPSQVLMEAVQQPLELTCTVSLTLRKGAQPSISCTEESL